MFVNAFTDEVRLNRTELRCLDRAAKIINKLPMGLNIANEVERLKNEYSPKPKDEEPDEKGGES